MVWCNWWQVNRNFCVWKQFNGRHVWRIPEEWVTRFVGRHPVNGKEPNVLPTWWGSPHYSRLVREYLNASFPNRWLGRGGPFAWAPRSPDLTPLDYYLWGHIKTLVYETKVDWRAALRDRIFTAAEHIGNHPENIASAAQSLLMSAENCIATGGGHFEQLL